MDIIITNESSLQSIKLSG